MWLVLQIAIPIVLYLVFSFAFSEDEDDLRYFLILPLGIVLAVAGIGGFILLLSWIYSH